MLAVGYAANDAVFALHRKEANDGKDLSATMYVSRWVSILPNDVEDSLKF